MQCPQCWRGVKPTKEKTCPDCGAQVDITKDDDGRETVTLVAIGGEPEEAAEAPTTKPTRPPRKTR